MRSHSIRTPRTRSRAPILPALRRALDVWRQRRTLARLDARALEDIGIPRADAEAEARRPLWDVPDNWRRR